MLNESTVDLLEKLIKNPESARKFLTGESAKEILSSMQSASSDKDLTMKNMRLLNQACKDPNLAAEVGKHKGIDYVLSAMNQYPTDKHITDVAGEVLENLGAVKLSKAVKA